MGNVLPLRPLSESPEAPAHLSDAMREWWNEAIDAYVLERHHFLLLQRAAEAWDAAERCRIIVEELGPSYSDRFGAPRERPEVKTWRDSVTLFRQLVRELQLELPPDDPRPPRMY